MAVAVPRRQQALLPESRRSSDTVGAVVAVPETAIQAAKMAVMAGAVVVVAKCTTRKRRRNDIGGAYLLLRGSFCSR